LLPLILPSGVGIDRLARAVIGLGLVIAAYMAEAVRGGLQALPSGQREAATALGLTYWKATGLIILPQALRISLPAMTNEFIALVKNTTLVLVVSILDLLGIAQASLADPNWVGMNMEAYFFSGGIYWLICYGLSRWSRALERRGRQMTTLKPTWLDPWSLMNLVGLHHPRLRWSRVVFKMWMLATRLETPRVSGFRAPPRGPLRNTAVFPSSHHSLDTRGCRPSAAAGGGR
jgi:hypothetical protein